MALTTRQQNRLIERRRGERRIARKRLAKVLEREHIGYRIVATDLEQRIVRVHVRPFEILAHGSFDVSIPFDMSAADIVKLVQTTAKFAQAC